MKAEPSGPEPVTRIHGNFLWAAERRCLAWLCQRLPAWVTPDQLTGLGVASSVLIFAAYVLSADDPAWLWFAIAGYVVHWFGDSLDGSLARFRKIERPGYGYFIDHSCDGLATLLILGGVGLSPYVRVDVALFAVSGYLLLAVHTFLAARVTGRFRLAHLGAGPTEVRLALIALTLGMLWLGPDAGRIGAFSAFDLFVGSAAAISIAIFVIQTLKTGNRLLKRELVGNSKAN